MAEPEDSLSSELAEKQPRIIVQQVFDGLCDTARVGGRSKTPSKAASLLEFYEFVRLAIRDQESRAGISEKNSVKYTEEETDIPSDTETITFSLIRRIPGQFSGGPPFSSRVQNLRPMQREQGRLPEQPGCRQLVTGYWYDNLVRFTCWARTNKVVNARAEFFENLMEEYSWWFALQGVNRVIFWERNTDLVTEIDNNRWYGRPIDYFVRTEKIRVFQEKVMEEILIKLQVNPVDKNKK